MPSKKKKYNSRFPPARIKKIMQTDEDIGKVAAAVPVLISKCLEMFLASLLTKAGEVTKSKRAKTMSRTHLKECILSETMFDFLKDHVANIPDMQNEEEASGSMSFPVEKDNTKKVVRKRSLPKAKKTPKKRPKLGHEESDEDTDVADDASENGSGNEASDASLQSPGLLSPTIHRKLESQSSLIHTESSEVKAPDRKPSIHIPLDMLMSNDEIPASVKIEKPEATPEASAELQSNSTETDIKPKLQSTTLIQTIVPEVASGTKGQQDSPVRKGVIVANTAAYAQHAHSLSPTNAQNPSKNFNSTPGLVQKQSQPESDTVRVTKIDKEALPHMSSESAQDSVPPINPQPGSMLSLLYSPVPVSLSPMQIPPTVQRASSVSSQEKYAYSPLTQHRFSEPRQPLLYPSAPPTSNGGQGPSGYPYQYAPYTPSSTQRHYLGYPQAILTPPSHHIPNINAHMASHPSLIQVKPTPRTRSDDDDYDT